MIGIGKLLAVAGLALIASACGRPAAESATTSPSAICGDAPDGEITVAAAASLTESFTQLGRNLERHCPGITVTFTFDSSATLARQIIDGAPVDVFASADEGNMAKLRTAGLVTGKPATFARNRLAIVTQPENPTSIRSLADLATSGVISLCGEDAPCGMFAAQALDRAGVTIAESSVTRGQNATATLTAVSEGDAVAGIVYITDALAAGGGVEVVRIPNDQNVIATYPAAVVTTAPQPGPANAFVSYLTSAEGQEVLAAQGFLPPP